MASRCRKGLPKRGTSKKGIVSTMLRQLIPNASPACDSVADAALTPASLADNSLPMVYGYVARRIAPRQEAEDVTADVFAAALESLPRFDGRCSVRAWLLGIARRKVADSLRRKSRRRETLSSELDETMTADRGFSPPRQTDVPDAELQRKEARQVLHEILAGLTPDQQEALRLQYQEELSVAEIAQVMRRSPAAITGLLQRARAAIYRKGHAYFLDEDRYAE